MPAVVECGCGRPAAGWLPDEAVDRWISKSRGKVVSAGGSRYNKEDSSDTFLLPVWVIRGDVGVGGDQNHRSACRWRSMLAMVKEGGGGRR